jgi:hypothetical protein
MNLAALRREVDCKISEQLAGGRVVRMEKAIDEDYLQSTSRMAGRGMALAGAAFLPSLEDWPAGMS